MLNDCLPTKEFANTYNHWLETYKDSKLPSPIVKVRELLHYSKVYRSFSIEGGIEVRLLFLRSSHLRLGQLTNRDSGRVVSLFPSRYKHCGKKNNKSGGC